MPSRSNEMSLFNCCVTLSALTSISWISSRCSDMSAVMLSIIVHTGGAASTALLMASIASLSTKLSSVVGMSTASRPVTEGEELDDDSTREDKDPCLECAS